MKRGDERVFDLQKASIWKRISAALFDFIMLVIVVVGCAFLLSTVLGYDSTSQSLQGFYDKYAAEYDVRFDILPEEYNALDDATRARYDAAHKAISSDEEANRLYMLLFHYTILICVFSVLIAYLLLEFMVPLLFKNGQTLGKKIFGVGVMREDGVKLAPIVLFIRTVLGKYTVETMIPLMILILIFFGVMGIFGIVMLGILLVIEIAMLISGPARTLLHDKMARTVTVDIASQMIFESEEELIAYKKRLHAERAERADY